MTCRSRPTLRLATLLTWKEDDDTEQAEHRHACTEPSSGLRRFQQASQCRADSKPYAHCHPNVTKHACTVLVTGAVGHDGAGGQNSVLEDRWQPARQDSRKRKSFDTYPRWSGIWDLRCAFLQLMFAMVRAASTACWSTDGSLHARYITK